MRVRARLHGPNQLRQVLRFSTGTVELRRLLVLHAPDAAEVMIAIGADGGVRRTVQRPARVVVDDGLVVEVDDVERAVRARRASRSAGTRDRLLRMNSVCSRPVSFCVRVAHALGLHELLMHDVQRRLGGEVARTAISPATRRRRRSRSRPRR